MSWWSATSCLAPYDLLSLLPSSMQVFLPAHGVAYNEMGPPMPNHQLRKLTTGQSGWDIFPAKVPFCQQLKLVSRWHTRREARHHPLSRYSKLGIGSLGLQAVQSLYPIAQFCLRSYAGLGLVGGSLQWQYLCKGPLTSGGYTHCPLKSSLIDIISWESCVVAELVPYVCCQCLISVPLLRVV